MSEENLRLLIKSLVKDGQLTDADKLFLRQKAKLYNISDQRLDEIINEELKQGPNIQDSASGFIEIYENDTQKSSENIAPPSQIILENKEVANQSKFSDVKLLSLQGAMSDVYLAKQYGKLIIIKRIKQQYRNNQQYLNLFGREFEMAYLLDHPNIVRILDKGEDEQGPYYTMEFVDGRPLRDLIGSNGVGNDFKAERLFRQLLDAFSYIHKKQIIHRDIKPENIYVTYKGDNIKVLDFGLAACDYFEDKMMQVGTPKYAAPEQMTHGYRADQRADIYSLGKIFLEMLTGSPDLAKINDVKNSVYRQIILKATDQNPANRFSSCEEIIYLLDNPKKVSISESKVNISPKSRLPFWVLGVILIGIILFFVLFKFLPKNTNFLPIGDNKELQKADSLYNVGKWKAAFDIYQNLDKKDSKTIEKINTLKPLIEEYLKAQTFFNNKNIDKSRRHLQSLVKSNPNFLEAKELLEKCNEFYKNIDFSKIQVVYSSSSWKAGFADENGYLLLDYQFDKVAPLEDWHKKGIIPVEINKKWGFIDKNLNVFAECQYSGPTNMPNQNYLWTPQGFKVSKNGQNYLITIDENGNGKITKL